MSFEAPESGSQKPIDPFEIQSKTFSTAWKGYKIEEVRAYLAKIAAGIRELSGEIEAKELRLVEFEQMRQEHESETSENAEGAEEIAVQIIQDATQAARSLREQAEKYFEATKTRAEAEARIIVENAQVRLNASLVPGTNRTASTQDNELSRRELETARNKATEIIEQSKIEGRAMIDQARDLRNEILADLRHKRSVLDAEIADLATRRIEAYQSLARAVQLISDAGSIVSNDQMNTTQDLMIPTAGRNSYKEGKAEPEYSIDRERLQGPKSKALFLPTDIGEGTFSNSQVEIGGHLEEGIVRVFHKDNEGNIETLSDDTPLVEPNQSTSDLLGESGLGIDAEGAEEVGRSSSQQDRLSLDVIGNIEQVIEADSVVEGQPVNEAQVPQEYDVPLQNPKSPLQKAEDEIPPAKNDESLIDEDFEKNHLDDGSLSESKGENLDEVQSMNPSGQDTESPPNTSIEESNSSHGIEFFEVVQEGQSENTLENTQVSERAQRSKRADEVLARIRLLRSNTSKDDSEGELADDSHNPMPNGAGIGLEESVIIDTQIIDSENDTEDVTTGSGERESTEEQANASGESAYREVSDATKELLDVREELLVPIASMFFKRAKRILSDEQNDLLDKVRRSAGSQVVLDELIEEKVQIDNLALASLDFFEQVRLGVADLFAENGVGPARREISRHAIAYSEEFAKEFILPLRRRIEDALAVDVTAEDQSTTNILGSIYRDARSNRLEALISQYVNTVFCATILKESGYDSFIWVNDPDDTPCADCLDNSLAGAVAPNELFPTGHYHPSIHSGCRCLLVPFIA